MIDLSNADHAVLTTAPDRCPLHYRPIIMAVEHFAFSHTHTLSW